MRLQTRPNRNNDGSILLVTIVTAAIIGTLLASYLTMIGQEHRMTVRSLAWNSALVHAETGVEEALTHLEADGLTRQRNGWVLSSGWYEKRRDFSDGYVVVRIEDKEPPALKATGYYLTPLTSDKYIGRSIFCTTTNNAIFARGMVAKDGISLNGNRVRSDSFDSRTPDYSTGGRYDKNKARSNGDVATVSGLMNALLIGNAEVFGRVATGPGGSVQIGSQGAVGDMAWHQAGKKGIQPGMVSNDMNLSFPNAEAPFTSGLAPQGRTTINGVVYDSVINSGNYSVNSINLTSAEKMYVSGKAKLYVGGNVKISGLAGIVLGDGASLDIYVAGPTTDIGGNGVMNSSGVARNFYYWGLPSNTSISIGGNGAATMALYAPQANLTLNGGGITAQDFSGAIIAGNISLNGHFNFHYDEGLITDGPSRGYIVTSWNEE